MIALVSILFSLQVFTIIDRSISAYKENLSSNYALVIVSKKKLVEKDVLNSDKLFSTIVELSADDVIKRLNSGISKRNVKLLKLSLPKFYKIKLSQYPTPSDVKRLTKNLLKNKSIMKVENFSHNHDTTYKLLILFKTVIATFAMTIFVVTSLLIFKELRIWQFSHNERMNIMGLFGAPVWLRSAVLFRLAIVDALIASAISFILFTYLTQSSWLLMQFDYIGIKIVIFDQLGDFSILLSVAVVLSTILSAMTVLGHKEEV